MLKRNAYVLLLAVLAPVGLSAQQVDPIDRLEDVLPADVAAQVMQRIEDARAQALPGEAVASLALEGVAKGRSGEEVLAAVESLVGDMGRAQSALQAAGRVPGAGEVEAATAAMRMGVDGTAISELAQSQPSGRSLAVPMLVMGGLADRGLPSDEALARVAARLSESADAAALMGELPQMGAGVAQGAMPSHVGPALAGGLAGFQVPVAGINVPVGPPSDVGGRPGGLPGPGNVPSSPVTPGGNPIG